MKLWEAFKALDEGKEVEYKDHNSTIWYCFLDTIRMTSRDAKLDYTFRIKTKPLECWVNIYPSGNKTWYDIKEEAIDESNRLQLLRPTIYMREVTE